MIAKEWDGGLDCGTSRCHGPLHGQFKSHITCDKCGHESILFDPYNHISLPYRPRARGASRVRCLRRPPPRPLKVIVAVQSKDTVGAQTSLAKVASLDGCALDLCTPGATASSDLFR